MITPGTRHECQFIDRLARKPDAVDLLRRYMRTLDKRERWDDIDQGEVLIYAQMALSAAERREAFDGVTK